MVTNIMEYLELNELHTKSLFDDYIQVTNLPNNITTTNVMIDFFNSNYNQFMNSSKVEISRGNIESANQFIKAAKDQYSLLMEKVQSSQKLSILESTPSVVDLKNGVIQTISRNILRAAHDGIQEVFRTPSRCRNSITTTLPNYHGLDLIDIIWEGRNQAEHYTHPPFNRPDVPRVFNILQSADSKFLNYDNKEIKAYEITELLKWFTYEKYKNDMLLLT
jgi:hypothetical protein